MDSIARPPVSVPETVIGGRPTCLIVSVTGVAAIAPAASGSATRVRNHFLGRNKRPARGSRPASVPAASKAFDRFGPGGHTTPTSPPARSWMCRVDRRRRSSAPRVRHGKQRSTTRPSPCQRARRPSGRRHEPLPRSRRPRYTAVTDAAELRRGRRSAPSSSPSRYSSAPSLLVERVRRQKSASPACTSASHRLRGPFSISRMARLLLHDLGQFEHVPGLDLLAVVLEAPVRFRHIRDVISGSIVTFLISSSSITRRRPSDTTVFSREPSP